MAIVVRNDLFSHDALTRFRDQDTQRLDFIQELMEQLKECKHEVEVLRNDKSGTQLLLLQTQKDVQDLNSKYDEAQQRIKSSEHVLLLLDADHDGYIFDNRYIVQGVEGGRQAAQELQKQIRSSLCEEYGGINFPIMVRAFANIDGLARALSHSGLIDAALKLARFVEGFNTVDFCEFVSVGSGKDKADEKIKSHFLHAHHDPTCLRVILGVSHDNGYARTLSKIHEPDEKARIILLKSFQNAAEIMALKLKSITTKDLFRTTVLKPASTIVTARPSIPIPQPISVADKAPTYASQVASAMFNSVATIGSKMLAAKWQSRFNTRSERLDLPLPPADPVAQSTYRNKLQDGKRYCHPYFLRNECPAEGHCNMLHAGLNLKEMEVMRADVRFKPCKAGLSCTDERCIYGHHCPLLDCKGTKCSRKFSVEMHNVLGY